MYLWDGAVVMVAVGWQARRKSRGSDHKFSSPQPICVTMNQSFPRSGRLVTRLCGDVSINRSCAVRKIHFHIKSWEIMNKCSFMLKSRSFSEIPSLDPAKTATLISAPTRNHCETRRKFNRKLWTHLWSDLVAALTDLQVHNFSHGDKFPVSNLAAPITITQSTEILIWLKVDWRKLFLWHKKNWSPGSQRKHQQSLWRFQLDWAGTNVVDYFVNNFFFKAR